MRCSNGCGVGVVHAAVTCSVMELLLQVCNVVGQQCYRCYFCSCAMWWVSNAIAVTVAGVQCGG